MCGGLPLPAGWLAPSASTEQTDGGEDVENGGAAGTSDAGAGTVIWLPLKQSLQRKGRESSGDQAPSGAVEQAEARPAVDTDGADSIFEACFTSSSRAVMKRCRSTGLTVERTSSSALLDMIPSRTLEPRIVGRC